MSDNNQDNLAQQRRERFLANKQKAGGDANGLIEEYKSRPWKLFFDDQGVIQCFTQDTNHQVDADWKTHDFSQDQLEILKDKDLRKYMVFADPKVDNLYSIQLRPLEDVYLPTTADFLSEVEYKPENQHWEVSCCINKDILTVQLNDSVKQEYKDVYPISATRNGARILRFYITAHKDPHIMYEYKNVSLSELLTEHSVSYNLGDNLEHCSIYTNKVFDNYIRIQ